MPAQPGATLPAKPATPAAPAPSGASRWLGPIAGIAAGLGLAALLSHFGLPEGFGTFLLLALLAIGVVFAVRMLLARRASGERPLAYAPGNAAAAPAAFEMPPARNGAARPDRADTRAGHPGRRHVAAAGIRRRGFIRHAKQQFVRLQAAYDAGDRKPLADVMTPEMFAEIARDLDGTAPRADRGRGTRGRGARRQDQGRPPLGERPLHGHAARGRRRARRLRRSLEPDEARRRLVGLAARRHSAARLSSAMRPFGLDPGTIAPALANRALERETWAQACLAAHAGRVFMVAVGPATTRAHRCGRQGRGGAACRHGAGPHAHAVAVIGSLVPRRPARWDELVVADGDPALAATFKGLAETLPWFVERVFASAFGPIVGQRFADAGRRLLAFPEYAAARVGESVASFARDESDLATSNDEARSFGDEVAAIASRVDALAARVDALAARLPPGENQAA